MGGALRPGRATAVFRAAGTRLTIAEGVSDRVADKRTGSAERAERRGTQSRLGLVPPARSGGRSTLPRRPAPAAKKDRLRPRAPRPRFRLTRRATILALALCAVVVTIAYPLQEYLSQRSQLISVNGQNAEIGKKVSQLQKQIEQWNDPNFVQIQARGQLHFVKPGEEGFSVPGPANGDEQLGLPAPTASPWYEKLWDTVKSPSAGSGG